MMKKIRDYSYWLFYPIDAAKIYYSYGRTAFDKGEYRQAILYFNYALAADPKHDKALKKKCKALNKFSEASKDKALVKELYKAELEQLKRKKQDSYWALRIRADAYKVLSKPFKDTVDAYQEIFAFKIARKCCDAEIKRLDKLTAPTKVLRRTSKNDDEACKIAYIKRSFCSYYLSNFKGAIGDFEKALKYDGKKLENLSPELLCLKADALFNQCRLEEAAEDFNGVLEIDEDNVYAKIGLVYTKLCMKFGKKDPTVSIKKEKEEEIQLLKDIVKSKSEICCAQAHWCLSLIYSLGVSKSSVDERNSNLKKFDELYKELKNIDKLKILFTRFFFSLHTNNVIEASDILKSMGEIDNEMNSEIKEITESLENFDRANHPEESKDYNGKDEIPLSANDQIKSRKASKKNESERSIEELSKDIEDSKNEIATKKERISSTSKKIEELKEQVEQLKKQVEELKGQVEQLKKELDQSGQKNLELEGELEEKLKEFKTIEEKLEGKIEEIGKMEKENTKLTEQTTELQHQLNQFNNDIISNTIRAIQEGNEDYITSNINQIKDLYTIEGKNIFHIAFINKKPKIIEALLSLKKDFIPEKLKENDQYKSTPIDYAFLNNDDELFDLVLDQIFKMDSSLEDNIHDSSEANFYLYKCRKNQRAKESQQISVRLKNKIDDCLIPPLNKDNIVNVVQNLSEIFHNILDDGINETGETLKKEDSLKLSTHFKKRCIKQWKDQKPSELLPSKEEFLENYDESASSCDEILKAIKKIENWAYGNSGPSNTGLYQIYIQEVDKLKHGSQIILGSVNNCV